MRTNRITLLFAIILSILVNVSLAETQNTTLSWSVFYPSENYSTDKPVTEEADGETAINCYSPDTNWCSNGYASACDGLHGGLSTEPDGSITCSIPTSADLSLNAGQSFTGDRDSNALVWTYFNCHGRCDGLISTCPGGLSTEPDGSVTCAVPHNHDCTGCR